MDLPTLRVPGLRLRPVDAVRDTPWLAALYAATRAAEVAAFGWPPPAQRAFLDLQFRLQALQHAALHPKADDAVVMLHGDDIGRLRVDRAAPRWHLVDVALLPARQGQGLGQALLVALCDAADAAARGIDLSVRRDNPGAARLYARLGFVVRDAANMPEGRSPDAPENAATRSQPAAADPCAASPASPYVAMRRPPRALAFDRSTPPAGPAIPPVASSPAVAPRPSSPSAGPRRAASHRALRLRLRATRSLR